MDKFYNETYRKLEAAIQEQEIEIDCLLLRSETIIHLIVNCLSEVKEYVQKRGFKNICCKLPQKKYSLKREKLLILN